MNCPQCGEVCCCQLEPHPSGEVRDDAAWRDELSARLNRYRSRRKVRPPRYPSLSLPFEAHESPTSANAAIRSSFSLHPACEPVSNHALALDGMRFDRSATAETETRAPAAETALQIRPTVHSGAKIIEFPGFAWGPPAPPPDQLAEPVSERPRILEVPEVAPPPPALGGITMEAAEHPEAEKRPGIDTPLQSAPLGRRLVAALVDGVIIATASALFGFIFWKVAAVRPPLVQILGLAAGIPWLFWAAYQYLLIVYSASTPGLRVAGLELALFDGTSTSRSLRRWRVLAAYLSAVSAGMGYAWVFLDEDALCWHDRITHTYLAPGRREPKTEGQ
jgi:RDD family protein